MKMLTENEGLKKSHDIETFVKESNFIEDEYSTLAYENALAAFYQMFTCEKLNLEMLLSTHKILMQNLNPDIAGKLRRVDVVVGNRLCPTYLLVSGLLREWFEKHGPASTLEGIIKAHVEFEKIHPFADGNGRTGRLILNYQLIRSAQDPIIIYEKDKHSYYEWFRKETLDSKDWEFIQEQD